MSATACRCATCVDVFFHPFGAVQLGLLFPPYPAGQTVARIGLSRAGEGLERERAQIAPDSRRSDRSWIRIRAGRENAEDGAI